MPNSSDNSGKDDPFGSFTEQQEWQDRLFKKGCHKALDIKEDDMNIIQQSHGISGKHLLGVGVMVLAGLLGWRAMDKTTATPGLPDTSTQAPAPQEYDVTFWVDGEEITVTEPEEE